MRTSRLGWLMAAMALLAWPLMDGSALGQRGDRGGGDRGGGARSSSGDRGGGGGRSFSGGNRGGGERGGRSPSGNVQGSPQRSQSMQRQPNMQRQNVQRGESARPSQRSEIGRVQQQRPQQQRSFYRGPEQGQQFGRTQSEQQPSQRSRDFERTWDRGDRTGRSEFGRQDFQRDARSRDRSDRFNQQVQDRDRFQRERDRDDSLSRDVVRDRDRDARDFTRDRDRDRDRDGQRDWRDIVRDRDRDSDRDWDGDWDRSRDRGDWDRYGRNDWRWRNDIRRNWWLGFAGGGIPFRTGWWNNYYGAGWPVYSPWRFSRWQNQPYFWYGYTPAGRLTNWLVYNWDSPRYWGYGPGANIYYRDNYVYYDDRRTVPVDDYYQQVYDLAHSVPNISEQEAERMDWTPLGVFAAMRENDTQSQRALQLAVNRNGVIAGTYMNRENDQVHPLSGMVDERTQRAAWAFADGEHENVVFETGIYNLTRDESTMMVHFGPRQEDTEIWQLVRLEEPNQADAQSSEARPRTSQRTLP